MEALAPHLAQAYLDRGSVTFRGYTDEINYSYIFSKFREENTDALIAAINQYLDEDQQLTSWVFATSDFPYGKTVGIKHE